MKTAISLQALAALALVPTAHFALGQANPGPSPTNSFGCEPHDDHWHCEGSITPTAAPVTISSAGASTPAPIAVTTTTSAISASSSAHDHGDHDHDEEDHDHAEGTGSLAPSPTASIGCEPHGDHWHCDGPRPLLTSVAPTRVIANVTSSIATSQSTSAITSASSSAVLAATGGASTQAATYGLLAGVFGIFGFLAL